MCLYIIRSHWKKRYREPEIDFRRVGGGSGAQHWSWTYLGSGSWGLVFHCLRFCLCAFFFFFTMCIYDLCQKPKKNSKYIYKSRAP